MMLRIIVFSCALMMFGVACEPGYKKLSVDEMKVVLWDMMKMDAFNETFLRQAYGNHSDTAASRKYAEVFALHDINPDDFYRNYEEYTSNPIKMQVLLDSLSDYSSRQRNQNYVEGTLPSDKPQQYE